MRRVIQSPKTELGMWLHCSCWCMACECCLQYVIGNVVWDAVRMAQTPGKHELILAPPS